VNGQASGGTRGRSFGALPVMVSAELAAREVGVATATIRKWVQLGYLAASGKAGRAHVFRLADVFAAERSAHRRPPPAHPPGSPAGTRAGSGPRTA
jgi:hypothetical protein